MYLQHLLHREALAWLLLNSKDNIAKCSFTKDLLPAYETGAVWHEDSTIRSPLGSVSSPWTDEKRERPFPRSKWTDGKNSEPVYLRACAHARERLIGKAKDANSCQMRRDIGSILEKFICSNLIFRFSDFLCCLQNLYQIPGTIIAYSSTVWLGKIRWTNYASREANHLPKSIYKHMMSPQSVQTNKPTFSTR